MKYNLTVDMTTINSISLILHRIKPDSKILEFGPATGYMTKYMRDKLNCTVYCIEIDKKAAKLASKYAQKMIISDIDNFKWTKQLIGQFFDYIIFADVLEHLKDPWEVLKKAKSYLKNNGIIFVSIPNIGHNAIVMELLQGKFEYKPLGLLDNTHLRFFTKDSIIDLLQKAGLAPVEWLTTLMHPKDTEFQQRYEFFPPSVQNLLKTRKDAHVYQYVVALKKEEDMDSNDNTVIFSNEDALFDGNLQVFWEGADGFTEDKSIKIPLKYDDDFNTYELKVPAGFKKLRIDPGNRPSYIEIKKVEAYSMDLMRGKEKLLAHWSGSNGFTGLIPCSGVFKIENIDLYRFVCLDRDPQLLLENWPEFENSGFITLIVEMKASEDIPEEISRQINLFISNAEKERVLLSQLKIENENMQQLILEKKRRLEIKRSTIKEQSQQLINLKTQYSEQLKKLKTDYYQQLNKLKEELTEKNEKLTLVSNEMKDNQSQLIMLKASLEEKENKCNKLINEIDSLKVVLNEQERHLKEQSRLVQELQSILNERNAQIDMIVNSTSWRITAPVRWIGSLIKRLVTT